MPLAHVRGIAINYEILGEHGPWVAISPGGRRGLEGVQSLAGRLAAAGYRVLIHDRRNCGASDVAIEGNESEYEIWANDLHELLLQLKALPACVGGSSSGCRLAIVFALRHPEAVRALLLWRVTGGGVAARRLAQKYYGDFITAAKQGGMGGVCESEHFSERIAQRPANRERLMQMDPKRFIAVMSNWSNYFMEGAELPIIGATEEQLRSIKAAACIVPGNDMSHPRKIGENLSRILPTCELHHLKIKDYDLELSPREEWDEKESELAAIFTGFLKRVKSPVAA